MPTRVLEFRHVMTPLAATHGSKSHLPAEPVGCLARSGRHAIPTIPETHSSSSQPSSLLFLCSVCMTSTAIRRISSTLRHLSPAPSFASLKMSNEYQTRIIGVSGAVLVLARFAATARCGAALRVGEQRTREGGLGTQAVTSRLSAVSRRDGGDSQCISSRSQLRSSVATFQPQRTFEPRPRVATADTRRPPTPSVRQLSSFDIARRVTSALRWKSPADTSQSTACSSRRKARLSRPSSECPCCLPTESPCRQTRVGLVKQEQD
jgi:hypothetical protein